MGWDFFVTPLCPFFPFLHFFKSETWGKAWRFAHTESSGDLFMKMLHTLEEELTFGPGTCLLPTWWKLRQIIMLKTTAYTLPVVFALILRRLGSLETP